MDTINSNQSETETSNAPDQGDQERISLFSLARTGSVKLYLSKVSPVSLKKNGLVLWFDLVSEYSVPHRSLLWAPGAGFPERPGNLSGLKFEWYKEYKPVHLTLPTDGFIILSAKIFQPR